MGKFSEGLLNDAVILENLNICPGQTILDAGCGNGYMAKKFSKLVKKTGKIYALDPDKGSINKLKIEVENTVNIEPLIGDITKQTELNDSSVDLVYLSTVFHIFSDIQIVGFNRELRRILKPNAQLAIVNIHKEETPFGPPLEIRSSPEELREKIALTPNGLIEVGDHFYMQLFVNSQITKFNETNSADVIRDTADYNLSQKKDFCTRSRRS
jgi:ubiquinone/menaquinone biosynthesis C-methylase UbiE